MLEQLGEKQAFEAELSRLGFRHQDFILHVLRQMSENQSAKSNQSYSVTVTNVLTTAVSCTKAAAAGDGWRNSPATYRKALTAALHRAAMPTAMAQT